MSCFTGVTERNGEFSSKIVHKGTLYPLGTWSTERECADAYLLASIFLDNCESISLPRLMEKIMKGM